MPAVPASPAFVILSSNKALYPGPHMGLRPNITGPNSAENSLSAAASGFLACSPSCCVDSSEVAFYFVIWFNC